MDELRRQFAALLADLGFLPEGSAGPRSTRGGRGGHGGAWAGAPQLLGSAEANAHSGKAAVVRACVAAGLYPNVAVAHWQRPSLPPGAPPPRREGAGAQLQLLTRSHGAVAMHPGSLCAGTLAAAPPRGSVQGGGEGLGGGGAEGGGEGSLPEHWRFAVYHEMVQTTRVYIRDATLVGAYPLLLLAGDVEVDHAARVRHPRCVS